MKGIVVHCERRDALGHLWRWRHLCSDATDAAVCVEQVRQALPDVTVRADLPRLPERGQLELWGAR